jgi:hypothetical protein
LSRADKLCKSCVVVGALMDRNLTARGKSSLQFARLPNSRDCMRHDQQLHSLDEIEFGCRLFARLVSIIHGSIVRETQEEFCGTGR